MNPVEQFGKPTMSPSQIALWVERLNPKPKQRTVPGPAMVINNHRARRNFAKNTPRPPQRPATAHKHHWLIETPNGATCEAQCKTCGETKVFPTTLEDCNTSLTVKADRGGRW